MTLSVRLDKVTYNIPTTAIDTSAVVKALGQENTSIIPFSVEIQPMKTSDITVSEGEQVIPPVRFEVRASFDGRETEIDRFERFVPRELEVTEAQAKRITTAVAKTMTAANATFPPSSISSAASGLQGLAPAQTPFTRLS